MNIFVFSTPQTEHIAQKIAYKFPYHSITSYSGDFYELNSNNKSISILLERTIKRTDLIVVLLDNSLLNLYDDIFGTIIPLLLHKKLLVIQIDSTKIPSELKHIKTIQIDSSKESDFKKIKNQINSFEKEKTKQHLFSVGQSKYVLILPALMLLILGVIYILDNGFSIKFNRFFEIESFISIVSTVLLSVVTIILVVYALFSYETKDEISLNEYKKELNQVINIPYTRKTFSKELNSNSPSETTQNLDSHAQPSVDALELMLLNLKDIKEFYSWSQRQAKSSFVFAIVMCILGFLLITASIVLSLVLKVNTAAAIISAIGGTITELISITSLFVYKSSLKQLNYYHKALHEDERFLSSINLIDKFKEPQTYDEMLKEIIRSEIQLNLKENIEQPSISLFNRK